MNWRYNFSLLADEKAQKAFENVHFNSFGRISSLATVPEAISPNGNGFLQAVEAQKKKDVIIIRVIIKGNRGINVWVPYDKDNHVLYNKYRDLRYCIRNTGDKILITFPELYVRTGDGGLYLFAYDFKQFDPDNPAFPRLYELI